MTIIDMNLRSGEPVGPRICRALRVARLMFAISSDVYHNSDRALDACAADAEGRGEDERELRECALFTMKRYRQVVETLETMDVVNPDRDHLSCLEKLMNIQIRKNHHKTSVRTCLRVAPVVLSTDSIGRKDIEGRALHAMECIREIINFIKKVDLCTLSVHEKDILVLTRSWLYNVEQQHDVAVTVRRCEVLENMLLESVSRILQIHSLSGPSFDESFVTLKMPKHHQKQIRWSSDLENVHV